MLIGVGLAILVCFAGLGLAQTFNFIFNQTSFEPDNYIWSESWTVTELVDFVEVTLEVTGSGYQSQTHDYDLTIKNVASELDYILLSCDYEAKFIVGVDEEVLVSGSHVDPILYVGESVTYSGSFAPSLFGSGDIQMSITNALWGRDEAITWSTDIENPYTSKLTITGFAISGASKTYEQGSADWTMTATDVSATIVSFELRIVETDEIVHTETDYVLVKDVPEVFQYLFELTEGGSLTMKLTITDAHGP